MKRLQDFKWGELSKLLAALLVMVCALMMPVIVFAGLIGTGLWVWAVAAGVAGYGLWWVYRLMQRNPRTAKLADGAVKAVGVLLAVVFALLVAASFIGGMNDSGCRPSRYIDCD